MRNQFPSNSRELPVIPGNYQYFPPSWEIWVFPAFLPTLPPPPTHTPLLRIGWASSLNSNKVWVYLWDRILSDYPSRDDPTFVTSILTSKDNLRLMYRWNYTWCILYLYLLTGETMFACLQIYLYSYIYTTIHIFIFWLELAQHEVNENKRLSLSNTVLPGRSLSVIQFNAPFAKAYNRVMSVQHTS